MTTDNDSLRELDRVARALHAEAVERVPARTLQQLRTRRAAASLPARARPMHAFGWLAAAACAAVFAIAIGLRFDRATVSTPADTQIATTADPPIADSDYDDALASYDEDPDLYLWLASSDAQPLAME